MSRETPIHKIARAGDLDALRCLLEDDPSLVDADDQHQWRPIFHAGLRRHFGIVKLLLDYDADVSAHHG